MSDVGHILVLGGAPGPLGGLVHREADFETVDDLEACLARLGVHDPPVALVVVHADWPRPLSAARRIRGADDHVGLAFAVAADETATMRSRLAFLPDIGDVTVVPADTDPDELHHRLVDLGTTSRQRRRVRGALDAINRDLAPGSASSSPTTGPGRISEHYLAALVRHAADTIVSLDPAGRIVTINEAGRRTLGIDPAAAEGAPLRDLLAEDDAGGLLHLLDAAADGRARADDAVGVVLREGQRLLLSATAAPILDDVGALAGLVLIARDVTAERQAEERLSSLQKAESLATLASGVAHDFNNLLVQIQGWADLAAEEPDDAELVASALAHVGRATRRASELARAMLAYGGRGSFVAEQVRLADLVADLRPLVASSVPPKIELAVDPAANPRLRVDATQIRQVIINLVMNAAEAIGDQPGSISIRTGTATIAADPGVPDVARPLPAGSYAVIEVTDTGPGIEPHLQDRLFDPFFTTKFTGRGLGLAASQGIAHAHGGAITVDGRPGEGARFRVHLPASE